MDIEKFTFSITKIIEQGKPFNVKFFILSQQVEQQVHIALQEIAMRNEIPEEVMGVVYTCIKEMAVNGTKANLKRVLFDINQLNINEEGQYDKGMENFKDFLTDENCKKYASELKKRDYYVNIRFEYSPDGLTIETKNNVIITPFEDRRMREKFKKAMSYENIAEFYMDQADSSEGAGMGIALIIMLIKGLGIDPNLFRIGNTKDNRTLARLEIPLTENYVPHRKRMQKS